MRPHRQQPPRLCRPWDSSDKNTGVGCHFLLQHMKVKVKSLSHVRLLATPWTAAYQAPPPMGFSRQEYWSGLPFPSPNVYSLLISFRIDCFDLLAVQGTLKSLLQYHSSKASILWHSASFMVQLSHPYMITGRENHTFD